jgi:hypothetical protein
VVTLSGFVKLRLVPGMRANQTLVVGRRVVGGEAWIATLIDLRKGEVVEQYELPGGGSDGLLRGDGKLVMTLDDGRLLLADLPGSRVKLLSTVSAVPGCLRGANWEENSPLCAVEIVDGTARILSLDVDLLCGG